MVCIYTAFRVSIVIPAPTTHLIHKLETVVFTSNTIKSIHYTPTRSAMRVSTPTMPQSKTNKSDVDTNISASSRLSISLNTQPIRRNKSKTPRPHRPSSKPFHPDPKIHFEPQPLDLQAQQNRYHRVTTHPSQQSHTTEKPERLQPPLHRDEARRNVYQKGRGGYNEGLSNQKQDNGKEERMRRFREESGPWSVWFCREERT